MQISTLVYDWHGVINISHAQDFPLLFLRVLRSLLRVPSCLSGLGFPPLPLFLRVSKVCFWLWLCRAVVKVLTLILLFSVSPRLCGEKVLVFLRLTAECQVLLLVAVMLRCE
jgi:hypothetical protein